MTKKKTILKRSLRLNKSLLENYVENLEKIALESGTIRYSIKAEFYKEYLEISIILINIDPEYQDCDLDRNIKILIYKLLEYLKCFEETKIEEVDDINPLSLSENQELIQITSNGVPLSFYEIFLVLDVLKSNNITFDVYKNESIMTHAGASGGNTIFTIISFLSDSSTIIEMISKKLKKTDEDIKVEKIDNKLIEKSRKKFQKNIKCILIMLSLSDFKNMRMRLFYILKQGKKNFA